MLTNIHNSFNLGELSDKKQRLSLSQLDRRRCFSSRVSTDKESAKSTADALSTFSRVHGSSKDDFGQTLQTRWPRKNESRKAVSPIRRILVPIDAVHVRASELLPTLTLARSLGVKVDLVHCYTRPPCFDYVMGPTAFSEVELHRNMAQHRLAKLTSEVRRSFPKCGSHFTTGSPLSGILRLSAKLKADLIAVPLSLDEISDCWTTKELLQALARRANCPVVGPAGFRFDG